MTRYRRGVQGARAIAAALAWLLAGCGSAPAPGVDLLLVTVDTLRADRLACYGGPPAAGKAICAISEGGLRFEWALATAPSTAPSIASLLTSLHPAEHGVNQNSRNFMAGEVLSVAEVLRDAGYATAAFVSNPVLYRYKRLDQGFEHYDQEMMRRERNRRRYTERHARDTTDAVLAWARSADASPWFLWVHYQDPHGPYEPPGAAPPRDPPNARRLPVLGNDSGRGGIPGYQTLPGAFAPGTYARRYLAEIRFLDQQVARLRAGLSELGREPALILTADHGEAFGEDGYFFAHGHSAGLDQIRVPLLVRPAPSTDVPARVVTQPVSLLDVAPTLLALAGLPAPESFAGRALPLRPDEVPASDRTIFAEASRQLAVVRGREYLARDFRPGSDRRADGHTWGDGNPALPARTATLGPEGAAPPYAPAAPGSSLESELQAFVDAHPTRPDHRYAEVPGAVEEQLRALGYTDDD